ncbi:DNA repair protein RecO (recombination protein O) [Dyadobacter jejuensis]|uniref:DNA repair protein RecO n=1 Tax=Dyadobacter jejuensis TaxID=1082580 RepID=A0A316AQS7_9BACT|nr:DNA repair protein RecO [Dyadobacter jejuensis]PWJ59952.1 DNA repair protein RecO (recombination protein O) [Dyadobacter jejuensis]
MLYKTKGIAISYIRFRESSIIAKIYTESFGIQSYIVNSVRSSKAKGNKIALFQPLTLLDLVVYHKAKLDTVHRISEMKCTVPFHSIPFDIAKSSIALFLTEILGKTLKEEEENTKLFDFLVQSILHFDEMEGEFENFHIQFLIYYASYLGFGVESMSEMERELRQHHSPFGVDPQQDQVVDAILQNIGYGKVRLDRRSRANLLEKLIFFYKIHNEGMGDLRSLDVLREVLR